MSGYGPDTASLAMSHCSWRTLRLAAVLLCLLPTRAASQTASHIDGRVLSGESRQPLAGAIVGAGGLRAETDSLGRFRLGPLEPGDYRLSVEAIGFAPAVRSLTLDGGASVPITVRLLPAPLVLAPVEAIGRANGVVVIRVADRIGRDGSSVSQWLRSEATGVTVTTTSGQAGAGRQIRIRGPRSLKPGRPLIFVDGVRVGSPNISAPVGTSQVLDFLDGINPADIEMIEVIRGPEATLLYGMEARDGVIRITTRRGAPAA